MAGVQNPDGERIIAFVSELVELSRKHGFSVWSCGCCDSMQIRPCSNTGGYSFWMDKESAEGLGWEESDDGYRIGRGENVVELRIGIPKKEK